MKETNFVRQNKEKWLESEHIIKGEEKDPEKLSNLFTQVIDDLSYSQTYYKHRSVRVYLNTVAREFFSIIYDAKKERKNHFKEFWLEELPQIVIFCRKELLISLFVFLLSLSIGVFSSANDKDFTASILGDSYVAMTLENIKKGDPMAVYKQANQADMFLGITMNNLMVACRTYVFGIFMSLGTIAILLYNGIMVGSFQYFFFEHGLLAESAMTIWLHGTLEISSIIIAGGAGLTLGSGLLFPGTYSRIQAFQMSAVRSLKLMLGIAPVIVAAGLIESFLTRYTEVPSFIKLILIFLSAVFIIGYFVVYPWRKSKTGFASQLREAKLQPSVDRKIDFTRIKNNADILGDTFGFYKRNFNILIKWILSIALGCSIIYFLLHFNNRPLRFDTTPFQYLIQEMFFAINFSRWEMIIITSIATSLLINVLFILLLKERGEDMDRNSWFLGWLKNLGATIILFYGLFWVEGWGGWILLLIFGVFFLTLFGSVKKEKNSKLLDLMSSGFSQLLSLQFISFLTVFVFLLILTSPVLYIYTEMITWNFAQDSWVSNLVLFVNSFLKFFAFFLVLPIIVCGFGLLHYSLVEVNYAYALKKAIEHIGKKHLKRGIENE